jgi:hypothetical protein
MLYLKAPHKIARQLADPIRALPQTIPPPANRSL